MGINKTPEQEEADRLQEKLLKDQLEREKLTNKTAQQVKIDALKSSGRI